MKLVVIVGARPQFIKLAPLLKKIDSNIELVIVNSGQHYDENMSDIFFNEMQISRPDYDLGVSSGSHGEQTAKILTGIEPILVAEKPKYVIVFGDTNTTLAASLAASKLCIPIVHIESGLRSFDKSMPEEQNRIIVDHLSSILSCPTLNAVKNLKKEGIEEGVVFTGDLMYDAIDLYRDVFVNREIASKYSNYYVLTLHRASNVDGKNQLMKILNSIKEIKETFIFPIHPRTQKQITKLGVEIPKNLTIIEPLGYLDMMALTSKSNGLFTDSGGMQKEAYFLNKKCITLRNTTEWVETISEKANMLALDDSGIVNLRKIMEFLNEPLFKVSAKSPYGNGNAAEKILNYLK